MNLTKLFEKQRELDARILLEKQLVGQNLLEEKILALQVELGELANEWRGFKFWSEDQEPRTELYTTSPLPDEPLIVKKNPMLEEYVDCLHFILSIGLELNIPDEWNLSLIAKEITEKEITITEQFVAFNQYLKSNIHPHDWFDILGLFFGLGEMLGFTSEQIEQAYHDKNKINHERQANNY